MLMPCSNIEVDAGAKAEDKVGFSVASTQDPVASSEASSNEESNAEDFEHEKTSNSPEESKKVSKTVDPLRWFGILVPPALRSAQSNFVDAVEGSVPRLATVTRELRSQEIEIGRVRKQIKKL